MGSKRTVGNVGNNDINVDSGYVGMAVVAKSKKRPQGSKLGLAYCPER